MEAIASEEEATPTTSTARSDEGPFQPGAILAPQSDRELTRVECSIDLASLRMLTVYQPWASLLVHGVKQIETRSRAYAHTGLIFIHAGVMWDADTRLAAYAFAAHFRSIGVDINAPAWADALPKGAIIGAVRMTGCMSTEDLIEDFRVSDDEKRLGNYGVDRFGWLMTDAVAFKNPIPCRGGQGPRFIRSDIAQRVLDELNNSTNPVHVASLLKDGTGNPPSV